MNRRATDLDPRLAAWLEEGPSSGPEEVLSRTFARARSTGQDRVWLHRIPLTMRFQTMRPMITFTAAAAFALAVGVAIVPRGPDIGDAPAPSASATAEAPPLRQGPLFAGDYTVTPFVGDEFAPCGPDETPCPEAARDDGIRFTFTVPDGWAGAPFGSDIWLAGEANSGPDGAGFLLGRGGWLYSDPCTSPEPDVPVGPTVDDFVDALVNHPTPLLVTAPVDVTLGGFPGKYLDLQAPADIADCQFMPWGGTFYAQGDGNLWHIWVIDVDGVRVVVHASEFPGTAPERAAELRAIIDSIRIDHDPALAPTPSPQTAGSTGVIKGWPEARGGPAGLYSWTPGDSGWMHKGLEGSDPVEIQMGIVGDDNDPFAISLIYAGVDVDPGFTEEPVRVMDGPTQRWRLAVGDTPIYVHVSSRPDTDPALLSEAVAVVESISVQPSPDGEGRILVFELPAGWDSG